MGARAEKKDKSVEKKATQSEVVKMAATKEEAAVATKGGTKRDIPVVEYTKEEFEALSPEDLLKVMTPRISERRSLKVLSDIVSDGTITITEPETLADWTYKAVTVEGSDLKDVTGAKTPKVSLKKKAFDDMDGPGMAKLIAEHTTEKRAGLIVPALMELGLPLTPLQVVDLSNSRIKIEGVVLVRSTVKKDSVVLVKGVQVNSK